MYWQESLIALATLSRKETTRYLRIWVQTLFPPAITMALYFVIFGNLIGPRIGPMDGYSYMDFIVPGIIMMAVITNSYANVVSSFFSAKFQRHIEELMVSPAPNAVILLGYVSGGVGRGLLVGLIVTLVSLIFTQIQIHNIWITVSVVLLTSILFSLGGFINGIFARKFDDVAIVPTFILTPLTYLGGVFYSVSLLPDTWRIVSMFNPVLYMVNAFRYGILGSSDIDIRVAYSLILLSILILGATALFLLRRGTGLRA
ncbi:ABC transporter permease [Methylonatrum kenyense]|uniref:ABC transporter permease n=1 Tax=Methylonatrum kenyense TaxID=455253 RepID=UPI0020BD8677|nr:ABC transporter permease [Methylonatrum kenyense]MCK8515561.1 ABC transporter permease [Methylonatrum kenyense]